MNIKEAIAIINRMQADGIIGRYAIGGAVGATFYLEPITTLDYSSPRLRDPVARVLRR